MKQSAGSSGKLTIAASRLKTAVNASDDHNEAQSTSTPCTRLNGAWKLLGLTDLKLWLVSTVIASNHGTHEEATGNRGKKGSSTSRHTLMSRQTSRPYRGDKAIDLVHDYTSLGQCYGQLTRGDSRFSKKTCSGSWMVALRFAPLSVLIPSQEIYRPT